MPTKKVLYQNSIYSFVFRFGSAINKYINANEVVTIIISNDDGRKITL